MWEKNQNFSVLTCNVNGINTPFVKSWQNLFLDAYRMEDSHFIECIRDDKTPLVTGRDGLEVVKVVSAGNLSISKKHPVKLLEAE